VLRTFRGSRSSACPVCAHDIVVVVAVAVVASAAEPAWTSAVALVVVVERSGASADRPRSVAAAAAHLETVRPFGASARSVLALFDPFSAAPPRARDGGVRRYVDWGAGAASARDGCVRHLVDRSKRGPRARAGGHLQAFGPRTSASGARGARGVRKHAAVCSDAFVARHAADDRAGARKAWCACTDGAPSLGSLAVSADGLASVHVRDGVEPRSCRAAQLARTRAPLRRRPDDAAPPAATLSCACRRAGPRCGALRRRRCGRHRDRA